MRIRNIERKNVIEDEQNNIISMDYDKTHLSPNEIPAFCNDLNNMFMEIQKNTYEHLKLLLDANTKLAKEFKKDRKCREILFMTIII